jgi:potassium-transporting ATPase potassium-binding subunit
LAFNTAISFATTTTWQAYGGETTMSYFSQIAGLTVQNFLAGAGGLAVGIAFIRGLARQNADTLGNFWVDLVRGLLWILLPLSIIGSLILVWQGVPANFLAYTQVSTPEGGSQIIAQGPVAVLEFIKNLGTNGGGFFNANGAHPFENPTPFSNFLEMLAIVVLPAALTNVFGRMVGRPRQGWILLWTMTVLFAAGLFFNGWFEQQGNPLISNNGAVTQSAGNMEGKETRFGVGGSALAAIATSNGATGSYNSMHDSFTPMGGGIPLVNMLLGEIIFGGLGTGLYSILIVALIGLFIAGLMIGRTPEYLGKRIGIPEIKLIMLYTLAAPLVILSLTALALVTSGGLAGLTTNDGAHGFTEILYAYTSAFANNGQNFAGLSANSIFYNLTTAVAMIVGRFGLAIPALTLAGQFAAQGRRPVTLGTLPTDGWEFGILLGATALIVGGLSFFPALALGAILEHLQMLK